MTLDNREGLGDVVILFSCKVWVSCEVEVEIEASSKILVSETILSCDCSKVSTKSPRFIVFEQGILSITNRLFTEKVKLNSTFTDILEISFIPTTEILLIKDLRPGTDSEKSRRRS